MTIQITHFSDVLCIWAYVGQRRMDEVAAEFGDRVCVTYRMTSVFGFARDRQAEKWSDRGGLAGYGAHVREVAAGFPHVTVHPDAWAAVAPASSTPAHLVLAAIRALETAGNAPAGAFCDAAWRIRRAFFAEARDIGRRDVLIAIAGEAGLDTAALEAALACGTAHAELARDDLVARELEVHVSPTLVMNEGRQRLNGNVGYRVIAANLRELLERELPGAHPEQQSWC